MMTVRTLAALARLHPNRVLLLVLLLGAGSASAASSDLVGSNTCALKVPGGSGSPMLDLEVTYLSEPVLQALFSSEDTRTQVRAAAAGGQVFLVRATARAPADFFPTSFVFSQGEERREPRRGGIVPLDGGFGGKLRASESTRGLLVLNPPLDLSKPVQIAYASAGQTVRFASVEPLQSVVRPEGLKVDPLRALEWKIQDLERRLQALEEKLERP